MSPEDPQSIPISADGSDRTFYRIIYEQQPAILVRPGPGSQGFREARSYFLIGTHLKRCGVRVPDILDYNEETGNIVVEDLGDCHLWSTLQDSDVSGVMGLYRTAVRTLAEMQVFGSRGFDRTWCFDTPFYDAELAYEREARYFTGWFIQRYLARSVSSDLDRELRDLCVKVDDLPGGRFFLHRDFQSRNLMLYRGDLWIIDFQGGRLGPLTYDLASLLLDPYVDIDISLWPDLIGFYHADLAGLGLAIELEDLMTSFRLLCLLRTFQVLGAYSFLQIQKGRSFFRPYIAPAFNRLRHLAGEKDFKHMKELRKLVDDINL